MCVAPHANAVAPGSQLSPLHMALVYGHYETAKTLLEAGADGKSLVYFETNAYSSVSFRFARAREPPANGPRR